MKILDKIVDMVIEGLKNGTVAWKKTWKDFMPMNAFSQRTYRGFNIFALTFFCADNHYSYPLFGTFKQITDAGGRIRKGEKAFPIVFWKVTDQEKGKDENGNVVHDSKRRFTPFYYNVFNLDQTEGIDIQRYASVFQPKINNPLKTCERIINLMPKAPRICHDQPGAFYSPLYDKVNVPEIIRFDNSEEYYATTFHELAHSTGHSSRLNRFDSSNYIFGSQSYSYEELVAERAGTLLCSHCGIETTVQSSVSYLTGWAKFLKQERKSTLFGAATKAQMAADYILGKPMESEQTEQMEEYQAVATF